MNCALWLMSKDKCDRPATRVVVITDRTFRRRGTLERVMACGPCAARYEKLDDTDYSYSSVTFEEAIALEVHES